MCKKPFITLGAALALGCAPGGQANAPFDDLASSDAGFELVIRNLGGTRAVFGQWDGGRGRYIGEIGADQVTFTIPIRGDVFTLEHGGAGGRVGPRRSDPNLSVPVQPGDRLEWTILRDRSMYYRRLPPR
jgi:hypothetical protein